jgi:DNA polymerase-3 subunit alpha
MGKKNMEIMEQQKVIFVEGAEKKGIDKKKAENVFNVMMEFAKYGFNRSHSAAYSVIAYQTAYLKAHYLAEYMAAVLTHNLNDIKKITFFVDECQRQGINVLGPDVNESDLNFMVNTKGEIRFGLAAIKNVGESAARAIIEERENSGAYSTIFDFVKRVNLRSVNKRSLEALAMAGAFDSFENTHRAQYFYRENSEDSIFLEKIIKWGATYQEKQNSMQASLFGDSDEIEVKDPDLPKCDPWTKLEQLKHEKDITGFYMSGHPLEDFKIEMDQFCNITIYDLKNNMQKLKNKTVKFAGMVTSVNHRTSKTGNKFATFVIEDFTDQNQFILFSEDYLKMKHFLVEGNSVLVTARIATRNRHTDTLDIRISKMTLLSEVLEKETKEIELWLTLSAISDDLVNNLSKISSDFAGTCKLKFHIFDKEDNIAIEMPSSKVKVDPSLFLKNISGIPDVSFKLK